MLALPPGEARPRGSAPRDRYDEDVGSIRTSTKVHLGELDDASADPRRESASERTFRRARSAHGGFGPRADPTEERPAAGSQQWPASEGSEPDGEVKRRKEAVRGPGRSANGSSIVTKTSEVGESMESDEAMVHGEPPRGGRSLEPSSRCVAPLAFVGSTSVFTTRGRTGHAARRQPKPDGQPSAGSSENRASCWIQESDAHDGRSCGDAKARHHR